MSDKQELNVKRLEVGDVGSRCGGAFICNVIMYACMQILPFEAEREDLRTL